MITTQTHALVAEIERLTAEDSAELDLAHKTIALQGGEIERLTKELAEAKRDAENYRALRDSKGAGDYAVCIWNGNDYEWSALGMPSSDIDARICEFAAMRRTDAGATSGS